MAASGDLERWEWVNPVGYGPLVGHARRQSEKMAAPDLDWSQLYFRLYRVHPSTPDEEVQWLLEASDVAFVIEHCRCVFCGGRFTAPLAECGCGAVDRERRANIVAIHPKQPLGLTQRLINRSRSRAGHARRARLVLASEGKHVTNAELKLLFQAQAGLCYYCGDQMHERGPTKFHHDHFVSLSEGGRRDLENAVLACPRCNLHKNSVDGLRYLERQDRRQPSDPEALARMRRAFHAWRKSQGFRSFKQLTAPLR